MQKLNLWSNRFAVFVGNITKYLRYILTGHLLIVLMFLFGWVAYNYQNWTNAVPEDFPIEIAIGVVVGTLLTHSPIRTYLRDADAVFLLPLEAKLKQYFVRSFIVSFIVQSFQLLIVLVLCMPFYNQLRETSISLSWLLLLAVFLKLLNLLFQFAQQFTPIPSKMLREKVTIFLLNVLMITMFLRQDYWLMIAMVGIFVVISLLEANKIYSTPLPWERLVSLENDFMNRFYRLANLFTDVPHLKGQIAPRKLLSRFMSTQYQSANKTMDYLFMRTFMRANGYFGLVVRLTFIAAIIIFFAHLQYGSLVVTLLFLYFTGIQLIPMAHHHHYQMWLDLYPIEESTRKKAVTSLIRRILLVQVGILTVVTLFAEGFLIGALSFLAGAVFVFLFLIHVKRKV